MEKYATYSYKKNVITGELKKVSMHDEKEEEEEIYLINKIASKSGWVKITNPDEEKKIENSK